MEMVSQLASEYNRLSNNENVQFTEKYINYMEMKLKDSEKTIN